MRITGKVSKGVGAARHYMAKYSKEFQEALQFIPYPGTLNLDLEKEFHGPEDQAIRIDEIGQANCKGVLCYPCAVEGVKATIVRPIIEGYPRSKVEIIAPVNLMSSLKLRFGSTVSVEIDREARQE